jgi:hypothetical protein
LPFLTDAPTSLYKSTRHAPSFHDSYSSSVTHSTISVHFGLLGESCVGDEDCAAVVENSVCGRREKKCRCREGYEPDNREACRKGDKSRIDFIIMHF